MSEKKVTVTKKVCTSENESVFLVLGVWELLVSEWRVTK